MPDKPLLGELLIQEEIVSEEIVNTALRVQVGGNRRIGSILVRMKAITPDQLATALAKQLDIDIIDISEKFTDSAAKTLPRYLCRKFDVIPLSTKENNILELAMANPSDAEAISDIEFYTGKVVEPRLALWSDIDREIGRKVPLTLKDFFTPQANFWAIRAIAVLSLVLVVGLGLLTFDYIKKSKYGTVSESETGVVFSHHDLVIGFDRSGQVSFLGNAAFSKGYYSVSFENKTLLESFINKRQNDFSDQQRTWLNWALEQVE